MGERGILSQCFFMHQRRAAVLEAKSGSIVVAVVDGELTVKRLKVAGERVWLMAENPAFAPLELRDGQALHLWGVVAHAVRSF